MALIDEYLDIWGSGQAQALAPTSDRTQERSVNVPMPLLPGALEGFEGLIAGYTTAPAPASAPVYTPTTPTATVPSRRSVVTRAPIYTAAPQTAKVPSARKAPAPLYDMIGSGARTTKAARPLPSPSPVADAPPSSVDASKLPNPPPPVDTPPPPPASVPTYDPKPGDSTGFLQSNGGGATVCPPCSCPGGISTGSILLLIGAAGAVLWMGSEKFDRFRKTPG